MLLDGALDVAGDLDPHVAEAGRAVSAITRRTSFRIWNPETSPVPEDFVQVTIARSFWSALS